MLTSIQIPKFEDNFTEHKKAECHMTVYFRILIDLYEIQIMNYIEVWGINVDGD